MATSSSGLNISDECFMKKSTLTQIGAMLLFVILIIIAVMNHTALVAIFLTFIEWMEDHTVIGTIAFIIIFCIANVLLVPGALFTLAAGFVYCHVFGLFLGVMLSIILVFITECIGATLSFLNARYLLRNIVEYYTKNSPKFALIEQIIQKNGFKVVILLRLTPLCPWNFLNVLLGVTSVKFKDYCLAHIAMIPKTIMLSIIGGTISHIYQLVQNNQTKGIKMAMISVGGTGTIIAICGISQIARMAKKEFEKLTKELHDNADDTEMENLLQTRLDGISTHNPM